MARTKNIGATDVACEIVKELSESQLHVMNADEAYVDYPGDYHSVLHTAQRLFPNGKMIHDWWGDRSAPLETDAYLIQCEDEESPYQIVILQDEDECGANVLYVADSRDTEPIDYQDKIDEAIANEELRIAEEEL